MPNNSYNTIATLTISSFFVCRHNAKEKHISDLRQIVKILFLWSSELTELRRRNVTLVCFIAPVGIPRQ